MIPDSKPSARYLRISEEQLQALVENWRGQIRCRSNILMSGAEAQLSACADELTDILATAKRVEVDDAMVERACEAYEGPYHFDFQIDQVKENSRISMRAALQAALGQGEGE
jgi:hypothetical protein